MIRIDKKRHGLNYVELWFPTDDWKKVKCDMIRLHCLPENTDGTLELQHTLWTDLTVSEEELKQNIVSKTFKYDIRRSERDAISIQHITSQQIVEDNSILQQFAKCYHEMYAEKNLDISLDVAAVESAAKNGFLTLSIVCYENEPIVFHSYLCDKETAILWHSCSNFRSEKEMMNIIGRANKRLHWEDWLYFKGLGVKTYDWGGVFAYNSENGIDKFKEAFGGVPHDYYHTSPTGKSLIGKMALAVYNLHPAAKKL